MVFNPVGTGMTISLIVEILVGRRTVLRYIKIGSFHLRHGMTCHVTGNSTGFVRKWFNIILTTYCSLQCTQLPPSFSLSLTHTQIEPLSWSRSHTLPQSQTHPYTDFHTHASTHAYTYTHTHANAPIIVFVCSILLIKVLLISWLYLPVYYSFCFTRHQI